MYLARKFINDQLYYILRESFQKGDHLASRDLVNLGAEPEHFIKYPGGCSFFIDDWVFDQLQSKGVDSDYYEVEDFFFPFLDPYIREKIAPFHDRHKNRSWKAMDKAMRARVINDTHIFDRRRIHFLRFGRSDQRGMDRQTSLYKVLLDKSRDELEQLVIEREQGLGPIEYNRYIFTIFDLQRFFTESCARIMPQVLDGDKVDHCFVKEVCNLDKDEGFWEGMKRTDCVPNYLIRYVVMYFDYSFPVGNSWDNFVHSFMGSRRRHQATRGSQRMSMDKATTVFGVSRKDLAAMDRKELTRLYRKKAHELHPDKGGDNDRFVELTAAYNELLRTR
ncbi:MAG: hypothetical protein GQ559_06325 [Desulfobulbaceae bacterium]|nr:hypothetical protein [Desulfobulbaceae bacterium]